MKGQVAPLAIVKLYYFDGPGRGDLIRIMLHYGAQKFDDFLITEDMWMELKDQMPLGLVPVIELNQNQMIPETGAIVRFLARKLKLDGHTPINSARCDAVFTLMIKSSIKAVMAVNDRSGDRKAIFNNFLNYDLPDLVATFKSLAVKYGKDGYVIGDTITYVDFAIYVFASLLSLLIQRPCINDEFIEENKRKIESLPQLVEYFKNRPSDDELFEKLIAILEG
ncbi:hypothetical protein ACOME3_004200 [Neoechinorhynchus agilis]